MKRSAWIAGGTATVVLGAAVEGRHLYRLTKGCTPPPPPPPHATNVQVTAATFHSKILNKDVGTQTIWAPATANRNEPHALIFGLPGRGGTAVDHVSGLRLSDYLGESMRNAKRPVRFVAVDGGESYWHPRRSGEDRMRMLIEEVVIPTQRKANIGCANTGIIGWSMGAYGAMLAAELYPEVLGAVCGASVAMWRNAVEQQSAVPDAFDDASDFAHYDLTRRADALKNTRVRISCGTHDPFFENDRYLANVLRKRGIPLETSFLPGCHDDAFWQRSAPQDIAFLLKAIA